MKLLLGILILSCTILAQAFASPTPEDLLYYRNLTLSLRTDAVFKVPQINQDQLYDYSLAIGSPIYAQPMVSDVSVIDQPDKFMRSFWDRIFLKDGSKVVINGEEIPLTCIFVSGQDNRYAGEPNPLIPQFIMRVYLVANDFSCVGPINPGWPDNGGKKETWDTYVYYEVRDPTIMLPVEAKLRYRWNEFHSILVR